MSKILRIITRLNVGGPAKHVSWVSSRLQEKGWDTVLVSGKVEEDEDDLSPFVPASVEQVKIPSLIRNLHPIHDLRAFLAILRQMFLHRPSIVHTHTSKAGLLGRLAAWIYRLVTFRKVKVVHTFHGHTFHSYFHPLKTKLFLFLEKFLANFCTDKIITISRQQKTEILDEFGVGTASQHVIIPLGVDFSFTTELHRSRLKELHHIPAEHNLVGIVGRIAPVKNHPSFLRMCKFLEEECSDLSFLVIGGGSKEDLRILEDLKNELDLQRLKFAGNVENPRWIYGCLDALVVTSKNEGTPVSILEAFASKIPVVSTKAGGTVDLIGHDQERGFLVEQGENQESELARCVLEALESKNENIKVSTAYEFVMENYSVQRLCDDLHRLYLSLAPETTKEASFSKNNS